MKPTVAIILIAASAVSACTRVNPEASAQAAASSARASEPTPPPYPPIDDHAADGAVFEYY